jgi:hypothetical protein
MIRVYPLNPAPGGVPAAEDGGWSVTRIGSYCWMNCLPQKCVWVDQDSENRSRLTLSGAEGTLAGDRQVTQASAIRNKKVFQAESDWGTIGAIFMS